MEAEVVTAVVHKSEEVTEETEAAVVSPAVVLRDP